MVPEFEHFILPVLKIVSDFGTITRADVRELICEHFNFSEEEKKKLQEVATALNTRIVANGL